MNKNMAKRGQPAVPFLFLIGERRKNPRTSQKNFNIENRGMRWRSLVEVIYLELTEKK
jgi:hypothetical protein